MDYIIGDVHGQSDALYRLLDAINFDSTCDKLWLCGDLVARGEDSYAVLRLCHDLAMTGALHTVLGNHDLTLIACHLGVRAPKPRDNTEALLSHPDAPKLIDWLRTQPFLLDLPNGGLLVHAGLPPHWTLADARKHNDKLVSLYRAPRTKLISHLKDDKKSAELSDYMTRMRLCTKTGKLDHGFKSGIDAIMPKGFLPWYAWGGKIKPKIYFGHWAALGGLVDTPRARNLDGGAAWGGALIGHCIQTGVDVRVSVRQ